MTMRHFKKLELLSIEVPIAHLTEYYEEEIRAVLDPASRINTAPIPKIHPDAIAWNQYKLHLAKNALDFTPNRMRSIIKTCRYLYTADESQDIIQNATHVFPLTNGSLLFVREIKPGTVKKMHREVFNER